ncbi:MAG TPA: LUD domain-containing protein [Anaerolineales bacterium]|nr:LUD domain-containing protein [Anaerolineales bacterium]
MKQTKQTKQNLSVNWTFAKLASNDQIERVAMALEANGIKTLIAEHGEEAEKMVFDLLPDGAEVFTASSQTLEQLDIPAELEKSEQYELVREKLKKMDKKTQNREMVEMGATPEYIIGSVHAVTEDGQVLVASNTGSQLAPYAASAANVIWVVGAQKIVRDIEEGTRRIEEYSYPREDERLKKAMGVPSNISKVLIVNEEIQPGRVTMIIVKEELGY